MRTKSFNPLKISFLILIMLAALGSVGCTSTAEPTEQSSEQSSEQSEQPSDAETPEEETMESTGEVQTIELWTYYGDAGAAAECVAQAADAFGKAQDQYQVEIRNIPFSEFNREVTTAIAAGSTPDLMIVDNPDHARFASIGALADLTDKVAAWGQGDQFYPGPWNSTIWDGKNYGVPLGSNTLVLWINADMAEAAGLDVSNPPQTWDDLMLWAEKMTDKEAGVYGITLLAKRDETGTFQFLPWVLQQGADIDSLDSPEAIAALQLWVDLIENGYASEEAVTNGFGEIYQQFISGRAAMMINGTWNAPTLPNDAPDLNWVAAPLPYSKEPASALGGENWAVFADSQNIDGAWKYLEFVTDPGYVSELATCMGYIPSRADVAEELGNDGDPTMQVFLEQMQYAKPRGPLPNWSDASAVVQVALQEALSGQKTAEQAMQDAAVKMDEVLNQ